MLTAHDRKAAVNKKRRSLWIAVSLALFTIAQTGFLAWVGALPAHLAPEAWLVTGVLAFIVAQAWLLRHMLPAHADMLLLMMAWGGFGMLLGWGLDGGLQLPMPDSGTTDMHAGAMEAHELHAQHAHAHPGSDMAAAPRGDAHTGNHAVYSGWFRWFNAMNGLMLLFAFPPAVLWARCLQVYRTDKLRLAWVLTLDAIGMAVGMLAGGRTLGHGLGDLLGAPALGHHLGMLIGMTLGMYASMMLRRWVAPPPKSAFRPRESSYT